MVIDFSPARPYKVSYHKLHDSGVVRMIFEDEQFFWQICFDAKTLQFSIKYDFDIIKLCFKTHNETFKDFDSAYKCVCRIIHKKAFDLSCASAGIPQIPHYEYADSIGYVNWGYVDKTSAVLKYKNTQCNLSFDKASGLFSISDKSGVIGTSKRYDILIDEMMAKIQKDESDEEISKLTDIKIINSEEG